MQSSLYSIISQVAIGLCIAYAVCFVSVLLHELAHAGMAARYGIEVSHISVGCGPRLLAGTRFEWRLLPYSGACHFHGTMPAVELPSTGYIAIAGPVTNLLLALTAFPVLLAQSHRGYLCGTSFAFCAFNAMIFFANAVAIEETDGWLFWNSICRRLGRGTLPRRQQLQLNALGNFGAVMSTCLLLVLEIHRNVL